MKSPIHRHNFLRLEGFDYTQAGFYFVTLVTQRHVALFGEVVNGEMQLNRCGEIVEHAWFDLPLHDRRVELGAFVFMPNHFHGIIILNDTSRGGSVQARESMLERENSGIDSLPEASKTRPFEQERDFQTGRGGSLLARIPVPEENRSGNAPLLEISKTRPSRANYGLSEIVRALKSFSSRRINLVRHTPGIPVWQRNYYDHIIRNQDDLELTWQYIQANPGHWEEDEENPLK